MMAGLHFFGRIGPAVLFFLFGTISLVDIVRGLSSGRIQGRMRVIQRDQDLSRFRTLIAVDILLAIFSFSFGIFYLKAIHF